MSPRIFFERSFHYSNGWDRKKVTYFEKYFTFTLLEYFGLSYDTEKIYKREQYWKKCLNTIEHGYNDN